MVLNNQHKLTRRERQIMDILISRRRASAAEIQAAMADAPGYSAVRATLRIMENKGHIRHEQQGASYFYSPKIAPERARRSALRHMLDTFFNGSPEQDYRRGCPAGRQTESRRNFDRIAALIERAREQGS